MSEWNLSDKRLISNTDANWKIPVYMEESVREFIKRFLNHFENIEMHDEITLSDIRFWLKELAGDKLI